MFRNALYFLVAGLLTGPVMAHEFWIEPHQMALEAGDAFRPVVMIGTGFRGERHAFEPEAYRRIIWTAPQSHAGAEDGKPFPTQFTQIGPGLHIFGVESNAQVISHQSVADFSAYIAEVGLSDQTDTTDPELVPGGPIIEKYRRFTKTLVHFGDATGTDEAIGLQHEWVLQKNGLLLLENGDLKSGHPAFVFCRSPDGTIDKSRAYQTDRQGRISPDIAPGQTCLVNATFVTRQRDRSWLSSWTSLLFETPAAEPGSPNGAGPVGR